MTPPGLDTPCFDVAEVARMTGLEVKTVSNWTDRGFVDPYQGSWEWKRGRGQARRYTLRDTIRLALMADLARRYQVPIPLGRRICGAIFSEAFTPAKAALLMIEGARAEYIVTSWCRNEDELAARLRTLPMTSCLVVNTKKTFADVMTAAKAVLAAQKERVKKENR